LAGVVDEDWARSGEGEEVLRICEMGDAVDEFVGGTGGIDGQLAELGEQRGGDGCRWALADKDDLFAFRAGERQDPGNVVLDAALGSNSIEKIRFLLFIETHGEEAALRIAGSLGEAFRDKENQKRGRMGRYRRSEERGTDGLADAVQSDCLLQLCAERRG
jgi:hypothetical protein